MNIKEYLSAVQNRPCMFLEEERLDYLYHLIIGYVGSNSANGNNSKEDLKFISYFSRWLLAWVRNHVNHNYEPKTMIWYHTIKDVTSSENEAIDLFFKLCDEFFQLDEEELQSIIDAADELDDEDNEVF